jgi:hypothetical protein
MNANRYPALATDRQPIVAPPGCWKEETSTPRATVTAFAGRTVPPAARLPADAATGHPVSAAIPMDAASKKAAPALPRVRPRQVRIQLPRLRADSMITTRSLQTYSLACVITTGIEEALEREPADPRVRRLAAARRRATALLAGVTGLFLAVTAFGVHGTFLGYVQAGAEAAMVGGIADWFAVTALFRRPLGLPIPHTALIVERKDQFAATLGQFVQENFLTGDILAERIGSDRLIPRLGEWLAAPANAARFAGHVADLMARAAEALRDEDVQRVLTTGLARAAETVEVAPLAGRALRAVIAEGRHAGLLSEVVSVADRYLGSHHAELRDRFEAEAPRWVPDAVYRRVFDRLYGRLRQKLVAIAADPGDETRQALELWLAGLPGRLETSPELSRSSATFSAARDCATCPRRSGSTARKSCVPRPAIQPLICAAGLPTC